MKQVKAMARVVLAGGVAVGEFAKRNAFAFLMLFALVVGTGGAFAADGDPDAAITNTVTTFTNTFGSIKTAILAVLVFAVGYKLARKWLKG